MTDLQHIRPGPALADTSAIPRRGFILRAATFVGALVVSSLVRFAPPASAASNCKLRSAEVGASATCRVQYGPPSSPEQL